jgi:hypothetical protein
MAPRRAQVQALRSRAEAELQAVAAEPRGAREAARGLAVLAVLDGNADELKREASLLRGAGTDAWADLAELWLAVRQDGASRDQAIPRLAALASAHPQLIRARFVLARALLAAGRREEAISAVTLLLSANPHHERAQRLRAQLAAPPAAAPAPLPVAPPPRPAWTPHPAPPPPAATNVAAGLPSSLTPAPAATNLAMPPAPSASPGATAPSPPAPAPVEAPQPPPSAPPAPTPPRPKPPPPPQTGPFDPSQG